MIVELLLRATSIIAYPLLLTASLVHSLLALILPRPAPKSLKNEIALVSGGAAGLGRQICCELAKRGCRIAIVDVNLSGAQQLAQSLAETYGITVKAYQVDVSDRDAVVTLGGNVRSDFGDDVTLLFNNAGIILFNNMHAPEPQEVQRMVNVNVTAHIWMIDVFLPPMKALKRGHIIATGSVAGLVPLAHHPVYGATKFAITGLMHTLRVTLQAEGHGYIRTTTVYPFFMRTNAAIKSLIETINVDSLLPSLTDHQVAQRVVDGVQRNESEIIVPHIFKLLHCTFTNIPTKWQDLLTLILSNDMSKRFLATAPAHDK